MSYLPTLIVVDLRFVAAMFAVAMGSGLTTGIIAIRLTIINGQLDRVRDQRDLATARWQAVDPMAMKPAPGGRWRHRRSRFTHWEPTAPTFVAAPPTTVLAPIDKTRLDDDTRLDAFGAEMTALIEQVRGDS